MKKLLWLTLLLSSFILTSCGDDDPEPDNTINSNSTVTLDLTWLVNGSSSPTASADLDLSIRNSAGTVVASSASSFQFDSVILSDLSNGTYTVEIDHYSGSDARFSLVITDGNNFTRTISGTINNGDPIISAAEVVISGDSYTLR